MFIRTFAILAAVLLLLASAPTVADEWGGSRGGSGRYTGEADGWRLGERVRGGFAIYHRVHRGWTRVPGAGIAIADGWVLGSKRESGGYAIYRWNGRGWDQAPGGAVQIGGSYRRPWVVNDRGQLFSWNGYDWQLGPGRVARPGIDARVGTQHSLRNRDFVRDSRRDWIRERAERRRDVLRERADRRRERYGWRGRR